MKIVAILGIFAATFGSIASSQENNKHGGAFYENQNIFIMTAILAKMLGNTNAVQACTCLLPPPPADAFAQADAVFLGKVLSFELLPAPNLRLAQIEVIKIWKGEKKQADSIFTAPHSAACGYDFMSGENYLIYAHRRDNGRLHTNLCTRTKPERTAAEDLTFLESQSYLPLAVGNAWKFAQGVPMKIKRSVLQFSARTFTIFMIIGCRARHGELLSMKRTSPTPAGLAAGSITASIILAINLKTPCCA